LSMNYLLPGTVDAEYTFKGERSDNSEVVFTGTTYTNVPVKANYRTNILGKLLTASTEFTVTIEKDFFEPDKDIVQTAAELQQQINNAPVGEETEIVLGGDIDLNDLLGSLGTLSTRAAATPSLTIAADKNIVLDLNGYTLSATEESTENYGLITNKGTLTINDSKGSGKIELTATQNRGWNAYSSVISNNPGGVLIVNGGTIEHLGGTDMAYGIDNLTNGKGTSAVATINGGAVKSTYIGIRQFLNGIEATNSLTVKGGEIHGVKRSIWMQGPSANKNSGNLEVTAAAKLYGNAYISTAEGTADWDVSMSIAAAALQDGFTVAHGILPEGYSVVEENGVWTVTFTHIANIGEDGYNSIQDAVAAVEDGETIIVNRNATFNEGNRTSSGGTWYEGVYYIGDKSFTIDLNNNTISQNGAINDYMFLFKNDGEKANTITFKNGTIDAGTAAYCALCTSTTSTQKITINLDNVNLIGNNSGGAVAKIRGGAELNINAGTVITGKNSYVGIEAAGNNTVVNIYEGAKIYQKGTSSYVGSLAGASGGATINVYGGEGVSALGGFIAMTSGGTVDISGGTWTANTDGTYANGNNSVLISQSANGAKCTVNVTGGTFKGGYNCYGDAVGDATINIYGGNFNANPDTYVTAAGYATVENNDGTWSVYKQLTANDAASFAAAVAEGGQITLQNDIILDASLAVEKNSVIDLNGKTVTAPASSAFEANEGGKLTIKNGKVVAYESVVRAIGGEVIIESGEFTQTGTAVDSPATYRYAIDSREGGKITINGGTFKSGNGMINVGSEVIINGGKFENIVEKTTTRHFAYVSALITINDGEFYGKANSSAGGCFFCGAAADGAITLNGGKFTSLWTSGSVNRIFESYYGGTINVTGGLFNTNGGIATFVTENTDAATKDAYPYVAK
ncbi:MAG: hypothetical protein IJW88_08060, partial [Alistipes sp.]|nr:hypothetical protein [Alistipes sp.]